MRRSIAVVLLLTISSLSHGQSQYGPWNTTHCYQGLDYCVKRNEYNEYSKNYNWTVKFRNRYNVNVSFNYVLKESGINQARTTDRVTLRPGGEDGSWFLVADANSVNVFVDSFRFGEDAGPYASCGSNRNDTEASTHTRGPMNASHNGGGNENSQSKYQSDQNSYQQQGTQVNDDDFENLSNQLVALSLQANNDVANGNNSSAKTKYLKMKDIANQLISLSEKDPGKNNLVSAYKLQLEQIDIVLNNLN